MILAERKGIPAAYVSRAPRILLLTYLCTWMFEGALRKWILPVFQQPLYFLRFGVVLLAIVWAVSRLRRPWPGAAIVGLLYVLTLLSITAVHLIRGDQTLVQGILGLRLWIEVAVMPLALGPALVAQDVVVAARWIIAVAVPVSVLALVQVTSHESAVVNKLLAADGSDNFVNEGGVVRASGLFTSSLGHAMFVVLTGAAVMFFMLSARTEAVDRVLMMVGVPAVLIMAFTSGSRSAIFALLVVFLSAGVPLLIARPSRLAGAVLVSGPLLVAAFWAAQRVAPDAVDALLIRFSGDGLVNEPQGRTALSLIGWLPMIGEADGFGRGIGTTVLGLANVGASYGAEQELQQWVLQLGPALFVFALAARLAVTAYVVKITAVAARRGNSRAAVFAGAFLTVAVNGSVTGQGSVNGFAVVCLLLLLGALNSPRQEGLDESMTPARQIRARPVQVVAPALVTKP